MIGFAFLSSGAVVRVNHISEVPISGARRFVWNTGDLVRWAREFGPGAVPLLEGVLVKLGVNIPYPSGKGEDELSQMVWEALNQRVKTRSEGIMAKKDVNKKPERSDEKPKSQKGNVKLPKKDEAAEAAAEAAAAAAAAAAAEDGDEDEDDEGEEKVSRSRINPDLVIRLVEGGTIPAREGTKRYRIMSELQDGRTTGEFIKIVGAWGGGKKDIEIAVEKGYITLEEPEAA